MSRLCCVLRGDRHETVRLELLLLLTALFASLTGGSAGDQGRAGVPGIAVVRSAVAAQAAVQPARRTLPAALVSDAPRVERVRLPMVAQAPLVAVARVFERRLE
jgi:hypothetical protein